MKDPNAPSPSSNGVDPEDERRRLTLEAMSDVEVGDLVSHKSVQAWAARASAEGLAALGSSQPDLQVPSRRQQKT